MAGRVDGCKQYVHMTFGSVHLSRPCRRGGGRGGGSRRPRRPRRRRRAPSGGPDTAMTGPMGNESPGGGAGRVLDQPPPQCSVRRSRHCKHSETVGGIAALVAERGLAPGKRGRALIGVGGGLIGGGGADRRVATE